MGTIHNTDQDITVTRSFHPEIVPTDIWGCIIDFSIAAITLPIEVKYISMVNRYWKYRTEFFLAKNRIDPITFFAEILVDWTMNIWYTMVRFLINVPGCRNAKGTCEWHIVCRAHASLSGSGDVGHTICTYDPNQEGRDINHSELYMEALFPGVDWSKNRGTRFS